ncbi:MAG: cache domain-containing protein [Minisyncoccia bacterium]
MSLYFFANNIHFALALLGAVVMFMAAWLTFDTYSVSKETRILFRTLGFALFALWQIIIAVASGNDVLSFVGFSILIIGLLCLLGSFFGGEQLAMPAVLIIPSFATFAPALSAVEAFLLIAIALVAYRLSKREFNKTWKSFYVAFALLGISQIFLIGAHGDSASLFALASEALSLAGFLYLFAWVWQFLALRIRESLVIIFISAAIFLSTVVTLAFSTILIAQITSQTQTSLLTDARVLDLDIQALKQASLVEATLLAMDPQLMSALATNDFKTLQAKTESFMEKYNLGFVTVTDAQGTVLIRAHALSQRGDSLVGERAFEEARAGVAFVTIEESPVEKLSIRAGAPVEQKGKVIGTVVAGYPLDNALVDGIKRVTGLDMFIYQGAVSVAATAFARDGSTRLTGLPLQDSATEQSVLVGGESVTTHVSIREQSFLSSYLPLTNGDGKIVGMLSAAKPEQDILDLVNATNQLTLITIIIVMLVLTFPIYIFAKRLTDEA